MNVYSLFNELSIFWPCYELSCLGTQKYFVAVHEMLHPLSCHSLGYRISIVFDGRIRRRIFSCIHNNCSWKQLEHSNRKLYPHRPQPIKFIKKFFVERCALFSLFSPATSQILEVNSINAWGSYSCERVFFSRFLPQSQCIFSRFPPKFIFCQVGFLGSWKDLRKSLDSFGNDFFVSLVLCSFSHLFGYAISIWNRRLVDFSPRFLPILIGEVYHVFMIWLSWARG